MAVSYKKLFHLLIDRDIQAAELTEQAGFSANILTRLRREQYVSMESIEKICLALDCKVDDILEFIPDDKEKENGRYKTMRERLKLGTMILIMRCCLMKKQNRLVKIW